MTGVTADLQIYAEEIYADEWLSQHIINSQGEVIQTVDENYGQNLHAKRLNLPEEAQRPQSCVHSCLLNFAGPRQRGLRTEERIAELVRAIPIQRKMALVKQLDLDIMPPLLLGLAESYVLSEAVIVQNTLSVVCRRLRFAYALTSPQVDEHGNRYDYDTVMLQVGHVYTPGAEDPYLNGEVDLLPVRCPTDCVFRNGHLFIADSGGADGTNQVHIWQADAG